MYHTFPHVHICLPFPSQSNKISSAPFSLSAAFFSNPILSFHSFLNCRAFSNWLLREAIILAHKSSSRLFWTRSTSALEISINNCRTDSKESDCKSDSGGCSLTNLQYSRSRAARFSGDSCDLLEIWAMKDEFRQDFLFQEMPEYLHIYLVQYLSIYVRK